MIEFPTCGPKPLYYKTFGRYLINILKQYGQIKFVGKATKSFYQVKILGQTVVFDFSDYYNVYENQLGYKYFKFHYNTNLHSSYKNIYPFAPISFYDWEQRNILNSSIQYACNSDLILNIQRPYGNAKIRRIKVKEILRKTYNSLLQENRLKQEDYWMLINNCLTHVFVPGAREDILDRGQFQYMSFGCCTISPKINDVLPYFNNLVDGYHYIQCQEDFSDLVEIINWCKKHRNYCKIVGENAKKLFSRTSTPVQLWNWIQLCLK